ncbi:MAG: hypothetical protein IBX70_03635 [Clostridia bacterium]|nr:hypothetical protein [Clostridia bacterium]
MGDSRLEHLYKWKLLDEKKGDYEESCYMNEELKLMHFGIRSKIVPLEDSRGYSIWVPLKDFDVAWDLFHDLTKEVIDSPIETYHVFDLDLSYKNKALYKDKYKVNQKYIRGRNYFLLGLVLLAVFTLLKFVKF